MKTEDLWRLYLDAETAKGNFMACEAIENRFIEFMIKTNPETIPGLLRMKTFLRRTSLYDIAPFHKLEAPYVTSIKSRAADAITMENESKVYRTNSQPYIMTKGNITTILYLILPQIK